MSYMKLSTKYLKILINYLSMLALILGCIYILPKVLVFFMPFVVAWIIALIANPLVRFLEKKIKIKRKAGSVFVIVLTLALVVLACYFIVYLIVSEASGLIANIPDIWGKISRSFSNLNASLSKYLTRLPKGFKLDQNEVNDKITNSLTEWVRGVGENAAQKAGDSMRNIPLTLISIIMGVMASYTFVAERDNVSRFLNGVIPEGIKQRYKLIADTMKSAVGGYFKAQFKIMGYVYIVLLVGFLILRIPYAFLIAILVAVLDFLPFFGTGTVMWPWALIAFLQKDYKLAVGMMIVWGLSQLIRQLVQPKMLGDSVGMPAIPTLFLLYVGFRISGAIGLIVAVPIGMIVYNLYEAGCFSNFLYSTRILLKDLKHIRVFTDEELKAEGIKKSDTGFGLDEDEIEINSSDEQG